MLSVPEGAILSPLLINIYMNDLEFGSDCDVFKYAADDTTIILTYPVTFTSLDSFSLIHLKMKCVEDWCNRNYLSLNKSKTQIMHIIKKNRKCILNEISQPYFKILRVILIQLRCSSFASKTPIY